MAVREPTVVDPDDWEHTETLENGVREYRSDRNHLGLEAEAASREHAEEMFRAHPEFSEWRES